MGSSIMVGDRWRDIEAGRRAGCRTVLIDHGYEQERSVRADKVAPDITGAVNWILSSHAV
jgi:D-glycero-D-manno-heptose 1,7-bisphosphate phosphatase